jgi:hypothetical protein
MTISKAYARKKGAAQNWSEGVAHSGDRMGTKSFRFPAVLLFACLLAISVAGCGGGGGPAITIEVSSNNGRTTVDASQTLNFTAFLSNDSNNQGVTWTLTNSTACSGAGCGTLSNITSQTVTYTAPNISSSSLSVTLTATSVAQTVVTGKATITIALPPAFSTICVATCALPGAANGIPYSQTITAINGVAPLFFTVSSGSLPPGMSLNQNGTLVGTPTSPVLGQQPSTSTFSIQVADNALPPVTVTQSYSILVNPPQTLSITTTSLPVGFVNTSYPGQISAIGGVAPFSWSITSGSLPGGLNLNPKSGKITGSPTTTGIFPLTFQVVDSTLPTSQKGSVSLSMTVQSVVPPLTITTTSPLPAGTTGAAYNTSLQATGGVQPYTWSLVSGQLPAGLTFGTNGLISGVPVVAETNPAQFEVEVTDSEVSPVTTLPQTFTIAIGAGTNSDSLLSGKYSFYFTGFGTDGSVTVAGSATFDGKGNISSGSVDTNRSSGLVAGATLAGTYALGSDGRGTMEFKVTNTQSPLVPALVLDYVIAIDSNLNLRFFQDDSTTTNTDTYATHGSGIMKPISTAGFSATSFNGNYAFEFSGQDSTGNREALGGIVHADGNQTIFPLAGDLNDAGTISSNMSITGVFNYLQGNEGGAEFIFQPQNQPSVTLGFHFFFVSNEDIFFIEMDQPNGTITYPRLIGEMILQSPTVVFDSAALTGASVASGTGLDKVNSSAFAGLLASPGDGTVSFDYDENDGGTVNSVAFAQGSYTVSSVGRASFTFNGAPSPRLAVAYLTGSGQGFIMGSDAAVTTGLLEQQEPGPFTNASVEGSYSLSAAPAVENMVNNVVGQAYANGLNSVSGILDEYDAPTSAAPKGTPHEDQGFLGILDTLASNGRGTLAPNIPQGFPDTLLAFYVVSPGSIRSVSLDASDKHPQVIFFDH